MVIEGTTPQKRKILSIHQKKNKKKTHNPQPPQQTPPHPTSYKPFIPHIKNTMQLITTVGQIREIMLRWGRTNVDCRFFTCFI